MSWLNSGIRKEKKALYENYTASNFCALGGVSKTRLNEKKIRKRFDVCCCDINI